MRPWLMMGVAWGLWFGTVAAAPPVSVASPLSPEASIPVFRLDPELRIELVAAEPDVIDPVAIQFDVDGGLWVVEMRDYPYGPQPGEPPQSRIRRLTDRNGDGRYESAVTFADQLLFVTGVLPYRDGLIVTLAGEIAFFADRNGDGVAEVRELWFRGFAQENSQLRANHPTFGPDGFVYVANGLRGGKIEAVKTEWKRTGEPLVITGFDFRFHPETGEFGTVTGHGQFGLTFDDFGRRFVCSNRNPCMHVVLEDVYLQRNPTFAAKKVVQDVAAAAEQSQLFPVSKAWTTSTLHANQFTAACGVTIYRGDALPPAYNRNAFTCDPTGNLVHREVLIPQGATWAGRSPYVEREFLSSPDTWFRPVNLAHGPDGALYVVDMYRAVIEHPDFMPTELKTRPDLRLGNDRGRIYRIVNRSWRQPARSQDFVKLSPVDLVLELASPNGHRRDIATRLLVDNAVSDQTAALTTLLTDAPLAQSRAAALSVLQQTGQLTSDIVRTALQNDSPVVREVAVRLVEPWLTDAAVRSDVAALATDPDARVRFQVLQSLARGPADETLRRALSLSVAIQSEVPDPWMQAAVLIAARDQAAPLLTELLKNVTGNAARQISLWEALAETAAARPDAAALLSVLDALSADAIGRRTRWAVLRGVGQGLQRRALSLQAAIRLDSDQGKLVTAWLAEALTVTADKMAKSDERLAAMTIARFADRKTSTSPLVEIALHDPDSVLQLAALETLISAPQPEIAGALLSRFATAPPMWRRAALDVVLANEGRVKVLLDAVEKGDIKPAEIDPARTQRLVAHRNTEIKGRAQKLLAAATAERSKVLQDYQPALSLKADPQRGRAVFEKQCMTCHRVGEQGVDVGPDIADSRTKTPDVLLTAVLDPNRAVDNNYFGYAVTTQEGKAYTGIITAETSASITLRQPEGKEQTILRSEIEDLRSTGLSLMPVGFEKNITVDQMADLISFLKNWRYLDGSVPIEVAK
jgi:putative membrane-bound dehydrogenase-like protein